MRKITLLILTLISVTASAQRCKFDYDKKDAFTGEQTSGITATLSKGWKIGFNRTGKSFNTGVLLIFQGVMETSVRKGDTLMLAFDSGSPMTLIAVDDALPMSNVMGAGIYTQYTPHYLISEEQLRTISTKNTVAIKAFLGSQWYSLDIPTKNQDDISAAATCILK